jgi:hypothetical protein
MMQKLDVRPQLHRFAMLDQGGITLPKSIEGVGQVVVALVMALDIIGF